MGSLAGVAYLLNETQVSYGELKENGNLVWNERVQAHLILIFSMNTNLESVAYRYLACGGQAFIARSLFDPLMSALPTNAKQNLSDCLPANRKRELGLDRRETG